MGLVNAFVDGTRLAVVPENVIRHRIVDIAGVEDVVEELQFDGGIDRDRSDDHPLPPTLLGGRVCRGNDP